MAARATDAGGARRAAEGRDREVVADHQGGQHQGGGSLRLAIMAAPARLAGAATRPRCLLCPPASVSAFGSEEIRSSAGLSARSISQRLRSCRVSQAPNA